MPLKPLIQRPDMSSPIPESASSHCASCDSYTHTTRTAVSGNEVPSKLHHDAIRAVPGILSLGGHDSTSFATARNNCLASQASRLAIKQYIVAKSDRCLGPGPGLLRSLAGMVYFIHFTRPTVRRFWI